MLKFFNHLHDLTDRIPRLPTTPQVWVCAPHPDDFDVIAVTLKRLEQSGARLFLSVAGSGSSGVEDLFAATGKGAVREAEQLESCRQFGLSADRIRFLHMAETETGELADLEANRKLLHSQFLEIRPDLICMPHGNDTNADHRLIFRLVHSIAPETPLLLNKDPKTVHLRLDLAAVFDEEEACWKTSLLRCHRSQDARNRRTRGYGFDHRILSGNRSDAEEFCGKPGAYAELFELSVPAETADAPRLLREP